MSVYLGFMVITKIKIEKERFENPNEEVLEEIVPWVKKWVDIDLFDFQDTKDFWIYTIKDEYIKNYLYDFIYHELIGFNSEDDLINLVELKNINLETLKKYDDNYDEYLKIEYGKFDSVRYIRDWHQYFAIVSKNRWKPFDISGFQYLFCGKVSHENDSDIIRFTQMLIQTQSDNPFRKVTNVLIG